MFALNLAVSFGISLFASCIPSGYVSEHYALCLSDTSLSVRTDHGDVVRMQFPATRFEIAHDGLWVKYTGVFRDIDLVAYRSRGEFEYDWMVAPGADPSAIVLSLSGADYERVGPNGDLILGTRGGEVRHGRPFAYQDAGGGVQRQISAAYSLVGDGRVGFTVGEYDRRLPLIIDPVLSFASGIGGTPVANYPTRGLVGADTGNSITTDSSGNIYIAGLAYSGDFPLVNPLPLSLPPCNLPSTFVAKLSPDGSKILYSTLLSACVISAPFMVADANGNVYVAATVQSGDPSVQVGGGALYAGGNISRVFVAKLDNSGALTASFIYGGSREDVVTSMALGPDGKLYIAGSTSSTDFPVTAGTVGTNINLPYTPIGVISTLDVAFVVKLDPSLLAGNQIAANAVLYSTYLGPVFQVSPVVAADASGNAYIAASVTSTAWTTTPGAFQSQCSGRSSCADIIALKLNPTGSQFIYTTYVGGSETETVGGIAVDSLGNAYISGTTDSFDFPTTFSAYVTQFGADSDRLAQTAFAIKLSADASHLVYGTLLSGENGLTGTAIAVDASGDAWVGGLATAPLLPVTTGIQQTLFNGVCAGGGGPLATPTNQYYCAEAGYLAELNPAGSALLWATYLGGAVANVAAPVAVNSIVLDGSGNPLVTGEQLALTSTTAFPAATNTASAIKISLAGASLANLGIQNAASYLNGLPLPGGLASLYLTGISGLGNIGASQLPLPTQLGGITVLVNGMAAPLLSVTTGTFPTNSVQVNFQVPYQTATGTAVVPQANVVEVQYGSQSAFIVPQYAGAGIFLFSTGAPVIQHGADYSLVTAQNPIKRGETVIVYATGLGPVSTPVASGAPSLVADPISPNSCDLFSTSLGAVRYQGLTPGFPGLYQLNIQVSPYVPPGLSYFSLYSTYCWLGGLAPFQGNSVPIDVP